MCTLANFPYLIEHCIEWARSAFTGLFETTPKAYNTFREVWLYFFVFYFTFLCYKQHFHKTRKQCKILIKQKKQRCGN